jgi:hypothetical protein
VSSFRKEPRRLIKAEIAFDGPEIAVLGSAHLLDQPINLTNCPSLLLVVIIVLYDCTDMKLRIIQLSAENAIAGSSASPWSVFSLGQFARSYILVFRVAVPVISFCLRSVTRPLTTASLGSSERIIERPDDAYLCSSCV